MARGSYRIDIAELESLARSVGLTDKQLNHAIQDALKGDAGRLLLREIKGRTPIGPGKTGGHTRSNERIEDRGRAEGVFVGYIGELNEGAVQGSRNQKGAWLESGTKPHTIKPRHREGRHGLLFGGRFVEAVEHPGAKPLRIVQKSLRAAKQGIESAVLVEIDKAARLAGWHE